MKKKLILEAWEKFSLVLLLFSKMVDYVMKNAEMITFNLLAPSVGKNANQVLMTAEHFAQVRVDVQHFSET